MLRLLVAVSLALGFAAPATALADDEAPIAPMRPEKPSGFWGGAERGQGAYRWRLLLVGVGVVAIAGVTILVVLRRTPARRER